MEVEVQGKGICLPPEHVGREIQGKGICLPPENGGTREMEGMMEICLLPSEYGSREMEGMGICLPPEHVGREREGMVNSSCHLSMRVYTDIKPVT